MWYFSDSGDVQLFEAVKNNFECDLPKETIQWKRNYGRASKNVILNPKFEQFDPQTVSSSSSLKSLLGQPLLHIFWAECMVGYFQLIYLNFIKIFIKKRQKIFWVKHIIIFLGFWDIQKHHKGRSSELDNNVEKMRITTWLDCSFGRDSRFKKGFK